MRVPEPTVAGVVPAPLDRPVHRALVFETWFVMLAFLFPAIAGAIVGLAEGINGVGGITRFPNLVHDPVANMVLGILVYATNAAVVPLALYLLLRSGQPPRSIGLGRPSFMVDVLPGLGLAAASFGAVVLSAIVLSPLLVHAKKAVESVPTGHVPSYYVIWGIAIAAVTSITEEVFVNGYLLTRLAQLGWSSKKAFTLSLILRTSYHVYYGIGFLFTIPFGVFVTRSFQKHRRLNRAIAAHFLYDAVLITISILSANALFRVL